MEVGVFLELAADKARADPATTSLWGDYPGSTSGGYVGGTSAAAATVSGVAALLFSAYPGASAAQVRRAIIAGANRNVPGLRGTNEANGLLSASGALAAIAQPDRSPAR